MNYNRKIILEDGGEYYGYSFGDKEDKICEIVFNTSMVGYQEIISDPSYTYQAVVMTYPLIGNYGMADDDYYVINVYYSNSNSGDGTKLAGFKFYTSEVWAQGGYPTELNWGVVDGNQISCEFIWK